MMTLLPALFSHYRRHPLQLLALAVMIVVATMLWTGVSSLTQQARASLGQSEQAVAERRQVLRLDGQPVTVSDFVRLRRAGVCVMPWLEVEQQAPAGRVVGVDVLAAGCFAGADPTNAGWRQPLDGKPFLDIGEAAARASERLPDSAALTLLVADEESADALPAGYRIAGFSLGPDTGELGESFLLNLDALGVLVLLITALLLRSVYQLGLAQRRDSFALLHRFGVPSSRIRQGLVLEIVALAALCVVPGVALGRLLAGLLGNGFGQALDNLFDAPLYAGQEASWLRAVVTMMAVVSAVCLVDQIRLPSRVQEWQRAGRILALSAVCAGLVLALLAPSLTLVFGAVALVFVGVGLLTPALLSTMAQRAAETVEAPLRRWQFAEFGVLARRLALPLVALQFALAMVLAVQALVTVFEATFDGWLAQRLAADYYIEVPAGADSQAGADWLATQDKLADTGAWHRVVRGRAQFSRPGGKAESVVAVDLLAVAPVTELLTQWRLQASVGQPWTRFGTGDGVLINEQLARRYGMDVGQPLTLTMADKRLSLPVLAVYPDYGRPAGEIMISAGQVPDGFKSGFEGISINPGQMPMETIKAGLRQLWQVDSLTVRANSRIKGLADAVFDQTFLLTRAMTVLTLVLAAAALLIMGWVFFSTRVWYYRLLAVWGLRDREVGGQLVRLAVALTGGIALLALPLGVWLTWVLVHRINPLAFGWSLPMAVYPGFWLELLGLSLVVGLSIAVLMRRQLRRPATLPVSARSLAGGDR